MPHLDPFEVEAKPLTKEEAEAQSDKDSAAVEEIYSRVESKKERDADDNK